MNTQNIPPAYVSHFERAALIAALQERDKVFAELKAKAVSSNSCYVHVEDRWSDICRFAKRGEELCNS